MFRTEPAQNRDKLEFKEEEVLNNFNFLIIEFEFNCIKTEVTLVQYEF